MKRELAIEFSRVTEAAALAGYKWLGRGDKNAADGAAVHAMRIMLNKVDIDGRIVIGEGEIDEAPMLYIGEQVGSGQGDAVDIAVDPIEGTRMTAMGQSNALAVLAVGDRGTFLHAPDMYMEKLVVGPAARGAIDLNLPLAENLRNVAARLSKPLSQLTVIVLAKPRHDGVIAQMQQLGVRVFAIPDGDVAASILTCMPAATPGLSPSGKPAGADGKRPAGAARQRADRSARSGRGYARLAPQLRGARRAAAAEHRTGYRRRGDQKRG